MTHSRNKNNGERKYILRCFTLRVILPHVYLKRLQLVQFNCPFRSNYTILETDEYINVNLNSYIFMGGNAE